MKQKAKIGIKIFTIVIALLFTAQSCNLGGGKQEPSIELVWWKVFDEPAAVQPLIADFQKANPHIKIRYVRKNIETYEQELVNALAAGKGPDIFSIHNDWLPAHKDKLTPSPDGILNIRSLRENFVSVAEFDFVSEEKIYAVPLAVDVLSLYYNKDILASAGIARPPAAWKDLVDMAPKLTQLDSQGNFVKSAVAMGTADNVNRSPDILELLMLQNGTTFYQANRASSALAQTVRQADGEFYSPAARALEFYTQFANPAKVTYTWNSRSSNSIEAFAASQAAMIFSYAYLRPTLAEKAPFLNYGIAPMPQIDAQGNKVNFANYWAEGVAKQSEQAEAAWQFLSFITRPEILKRYYEVQKVPSSRIDIIDDQLSDAQIGVFAEGALTAKSVYEPDSDAIENVFVQMIGDVVLRNIPPQEAVNSAAQKINLLLRSR